MAYRRKPITEKKSYEIQIGDIKSVACCMQGWRKTMEDDYFMEELPSGILMYGVLDGHGGEEISKFASKYLPIIFKDLQPNFTNTDIEEGFVELDKKLIQVGIEILSFSNKNKSRDGLYKCRMLEMKRDFPEMSIEEINSNLICNHTGSTVTIVFIDNKRIVTATAGDCQGLLSRGEENVDLQKRIHNLYDSEEVERVQKAGSIYVL